MHPSAGHTGTAGTDRMGIPREQLFNAGAVAQVPTGGVAYLAHVGGFMFGAVSARLFEDPRRFALQRNRRFIENRPRRGKVQGFACITG